MRKPFIWFFIISILSIIILFFYRDTIAKWYVEKQLNQIEGLSYNNFQLRLLEKELQVEELKYHIIDDFYLEAEKIQLKGLSIYKLYKKKGIHLDSLLIERPHISYQNIKDTVIADEGSSLSKELDLTVAYLGINVAQLDLKIDSTKIDVEELSCVVEGLAITATSFDYDDFTIDIQAAEIKNKDTEAWLKTLTLDSEEQLNIVAAEIKTIRKTLRRTSELTAYFHNFSANIELDSLIKTQGFYSESAEIDSFYIKSNIQKYADSTTAAVPKMVNEMIQALPALKLIHKLNVKNGFIEYTGYSSVEDKYVAIDFKNVRGEIEDLGQGSEAHRYAKVDFSFNFANALNINGKISYDLLSEDETHRIIGKVKPFETTILNPLMRDIAPIEFKSGSINTFFFDLDLNKYRGKAKVDLRYDNLKLSRLRTEEGEERKSIAVFLANSLVVRNNNPKGGNLILGEANCYRVRETSTFYYWWRTLYYGFEDVIIHKKVYKKVRSS